MSDLSKEQYIAAKNESLKDVHPTLALAMGIVAWERGHSYGYYEVINVLDDLVYQFREVNNLLKGVDETA